MHLHGSQYERLACVPERRWLRGAPSAQLVVGVPATAFAVGSITSDADGSVVADEVALVEGL